MFDAMGPEHFHEIGGSQMFEMAGNMSGDNFAAMGADSAFGMFDAMGTDMVMGLEGDQLPACSELWNTTRSVIWEAAWSLMRSSRWEQKA